jgi:hypothetical protein
MELDPYEKTGYVLEESIHLCIYVYMYIQN